LNQLYQQSGGGVNLQQYIAIYEHLEGMKASDYPCTQEELIKIEGRLREQLGNLVVDCALATTVEEQIQILRNYLEARSDRELLSLLKGRYQYLKLCIPLKGQMVTIEITTRNADGTVSSDVLVRQGSKVQTLESFMVANHIASVPALLALSTKYEMIDPEINSEFTSPTINDIKSKLITQIETDFISFNELGLENGLRINNYELVALKQRDDFCYLVASFMLIQDYAKSGRTDFLKQVISLSSSFGSTIQELIEKINHNPQLSVNILQDSYQYSSTDMLSLFYSDQKLINLISKSTEKFYIEFKKVIKHYNGVIINVENWPTLSGEAHFIYIKDFIETQSGTYFIYEDPIPGEFGVISESILIDSLINGIFYIK